ncbi:MAG: DUF4978 domain-containing protein, partial [Bacteroidales bacterium]|nr:DUF4978 domain-containing protein [Bacteroidales bacterium]
MKRLLIFFAVALIALAACRAEGLGDGHMLPETPMDGIVVSRIAGRADKPYLEVDGNPFAMYGAQIRVDIFRNCEDMPWDETEKYFAAARELNVNCVQVSYPWKFLEPSEDVYRFDEIDRLLALANKYDLKMELLWFSTNMIGDSYTWLVPQYILSVPQKKMRRDGDGDFHWLYGYTYALYLDDPWILERETKAVKVLFDHIRIWDSKNGNRHPVITCQVHNEPDAMVRWRMSLMDFRHRDGTAAAPEEIWRMTLNALDAVGQAVQNSSYKVATRTNIISGDGVKDFPQTPGISPKDVYALKGIDFVSFDPYMEKVNEIAYEVSEYAGMPGNYPLVAENRGDYPNTASLMLAASALGGGYDIYDLATSRFIASSGTPPYSSEGVYDHELKDKPHTGEVRTLIDGLVKASPEVALCGTEDFAVFNIVTDFPQKSLSQTVRTTGAVIGFETEDAALAFVLDRGDCLVAYSVRESVLTISGGAVTEVACGKFEPTGEFVPDDVHNVTDNVVALKSGVLYR